MEDLNNNSLAPSVDSNDLDPKIDPKRKAKSKDPGWKYGHWPDIKDKNTVKCNLCDRLIKGGIKRLKQHLCGGYGDISKCMKTTSVIATEMYAALNEKKKDKVDLNDDDDNESEQEVELLGSQSQVSPTLSTAKSSFVPSSGTGAKKRKVIHLPQKRGPMDAHVRRAPEDVVDDRRAKGPAQTTIERCFRSPEEKKRVDGYVADWFYECGIPFNAAKARSFEIMLEAVGQYGPGYKGPSYHDLRVPLLLNTKEKVSEMRTKYQAYWRRYGCTLISDGWTDRRGRHLINFLVNCPEGTYFMGSVDASGHIQDATMLSELLDSKIREIGTDCVVQVVTDNASNYKAASRILMERRPTLFWTPCAAHCIDLMLEDIGKLRQNKMVIKKARMITNFIYRHTRLLDAVRSTIGGDLVRHSVTRFATSFLTLQSVLKHEEKLKLFFVSPSWNAANLAKTEAGKQVVEVILSTVFWNGVRDCLKGGKSLMAVLRLVDGDERPAMPEVYVAMEEAKQRIKEHFDNKERLYKKIIDIVENRWTNQMEQKLYGAALFLNPSKYFEYEEKHNDDAWKFQDAFNDVIARLVPDQHLQDKIAEQGTNYKASRNSFGKPMAIRQRTTLNPMDWWGAHGGPNVELTKIALRNWSTFEFIHTKKRNRLEHQRLNDLVYIQYNRRLQARFQERREKGRNYNPLVLDELDWSNEWMINKPDDTLVFDDDDLTWEAVERAVGTGARNLRSGANLELIAEGDEDLDHFDVANDDEDLVDNYGQMASASNQPSTCNANNDLLDDDSN